jgi:SAM-dependent methyltransferase
LKKRLKLMVVSRFPASYAAATKPGEQYLQEGGVSEHDVEKTIDDFGDQWSRYTDNSGYYGSAELFSDIISPIMSPDEFAGTRVADIGSGTGRIVKMLLQAGAREVIAVEPSAGAFASLLENTKQQSGQIRYLNLPGNDLPDDLDLDYVVSIGVVHHIPEPDSTIAASHKALKSGGRCLLWLYGWEGNETYLRFAQPLRRLTTKLPHALLAGLSHVLNLCLDLYILACRFVRLPLRDYILKVIGQMARDKRYLIIYDQLNPDYAKYYREAEAIDLLARAGFRDIKTHRRHGYSWLVIGTK